MEKQMEKKKKKRRRRRKRNREKHLEKGNVATGGFVEEGRRNEAAE
jgi:hypothetical protein